MAAWILAMTDSNHKLNILRDIAILIPIPIHSNFTSLFYFNYEPKAPYIHLETT